MMSSPQQMQRLLQALSQSTFPIQSQPPPPDAPTLPEQETKNQLTAYAPPFNFDATSHHDNIDPGGNILLPIPPTKAQPSPLSSSKMDDLTPLFQEQDAQLQKSWKDASHIAADVDLMDSNIRAFIDDLGFNPDLFVQPGTADNPVNTPDGGGGSVDGARGGGDGRNDTVSGNSTLLDMSNGSSAGDIEFDFEDLLTQFSRQNEHDTDYDDLNQQLASSTAIENGDTDQLTAFLDDVASDTASTRQQSPDTVLGGRKRRK
jgi:hypothetical protein